MYRNGLCAIRASLARFGGSPALSWRRNKVWQHSTASPVGDDRDATRVAARVASRDATEEDDRHRPLRTP
jgi:hypothetical protein